MSILRCRPAVLAAVVFVWGSATVDASSISLVGYIQTNGGTAEVSQVNGAATSADSLALTDAVGVATDTQGALASYDAFASVGDLGLAVSASAFCGACGAESAEGRMSVNFVDSLFITGLSSGFVSFDVLFEGALSYDGQADFGETTLFVSSGNNTNAMTRRLDDTGLQCTDVGFPVAACASNFSIRTSLLLPFQNGVLGVDATLFTWLRCSAGFEQSCLITSDFRNTAMFGGARIFDTNQNPFAGASLTAESGYDYTQPIGQSEVPEPASIGLVGTGLLAGAWVVRRRKAA